MMGFLRDSTKEVITLAGCLGFLALYIFTQEASSTVHLILLIALFGWIIFFPRFYEALWPPPKPKAESETPEPFHFQLDPETSQGPRQVTVEGSTGTEVIESADGLVNYLKRIVQELGEESFYLTHSHAPHYCLSCLISSGFASLYFFTEEDNPHPGFCSLDRTLLDAPEIIEFPEELTSGYPRLITTTDAYQAVREFFHHPDLPPSIRWEDLSLPEEE